MLFAFLLTLTASVCLGASVGLGCRCAPLASCVVLKNGSMGCVCPYSGDGYNSCVEQRYITKATVRTQGDIKPWVDLVGGQLSVVSQSTVAGTTQYVLELDSTNYNAMITLTNRINAKTWPLQVALLGSATSRVVSEINPDDEPPQLELLDISFNTSWWNFRFVANEGLIFVSSQVAPVPCVHLKIPCCEALLLSAPFYVGVMDAQALKACVYTPTNRSQNLRDGNVSFLSHLMYDLDDTFLLRLHESELTRLSTNNATHAQFSVGVLSPQSVTQVAVSLNKNPNFTDVTVGTFTRQVATFVLLQVEQIGPRFVLHLYAQVTLQYATIEFLQYAWDDMQWIIPVCEPIRECISIVNPCRGTVQDGVLETYVPLQNHILNKGNITLYLILKEGSTLSRVMTQCHPTVMTKQCDNFLTVTEEVQIQILQGLTQTEIYRGFSKPLFTLNIEPQTDTLITLIARTLDGVSIKNLRAIHTRTDDERKNISSNLTCSTCVVEQLIMEEQVVSSRSCFYFGNGDEVAWIESYIGLVGSSLGLNVLSKLPSDVKSGVAAAVWINPTWPWPNASTVREVTYLEITYAPPTTHSINRRRLLTVETANRQSKIKISWLMITTTCIIVLLYHLLEAVKNDYLFVKL
jgi:hypothetical protein